MPGGGRRAGNQSWQGATARSRRRVCFVKAFGRWCLAEDDDDETGFSVAGWTSRARGRSPRLARWLDTFTLISSFNSTSHFASLRSTSLRFTSLRFALHFASHFTLHFTLHFASLHFTSLHTSLRFALHFASLRLLDWGPQRGFRTWGRPVLRWEDTLRQFARTKGETWQMGQVGAVRG